METFTVLLLVVLTIGILSGWFVHTHSEPYQSKNNDNKK